MQVPGRIVNVRGVAGQYSGTVSFIAPEGVKKDVQVFLSRAHSLLAQAERERGLDRFEFSYQCALRCAGAVVAQNRPVVKHGARRRQACSSSKNAWQELRKLGGEMAEWADVFEGFSPIRSDVRLGIVDILPDSKVQGIHNLAKEFVNVVGGEIGVLPAVA